MFQYLRSLVISTSHQERNITEFSITESSLEGLIEQVTIDRDTEGKVETTVREQAWELVDRADVLVEWDLTKTVESRVLSRATCLFDDRIVEGLMLGVIRRDDGRREARVLNSVTMSSCVFLD